MVELRVDLRLNLVHLVLVGLVVGLEAVVELGVGLRGRLIGIG